MKLIGLCGYARSGKDTAALALLEQRWQRAAFADALKHDAWLSLNDSWEKAYENDGINPDLFYTPFTKELFRPFLVEYGRAMRHLSSNYWIDRLFSEIDPEDLVLRPGTVITDVRYQNEVEAVHSHGGKVIMITRPGVGPANAEEEQSFLKVKPDYTIINGGTVEDLHNAVLAAVATWENA